MFLDVTMCVATGKETVTIPRPPLHLLTAATNVFRLIQQMINNYLSVLECMTSAMDINVLFRSGLDWPQSRRCFPGTTFHNKRTRTSIEGFAIGWGLGGYHRVLAARSKASIDKVLSIVNVRSL